MMTVFNEKLPLSCTTFLFGFIFYLGSLLFLFMIFIFHTVYFKGNRFHLKGMTVICVILFTILASIGWLILKLFHYNNHVSTPLLL